MSCAKTAELIEMPFWKWTRVGPRNYVLDGGPDPSGEGTLLGGASSASFLVLLVDYIF